MATLWPKLPSATTLPLLSIKSQSSLGAFAVSRREYHTKRGAATARTVYGDNSFNAVKPPLPTPPSVPLAVLPTSNLFRSLFVSFVSSKPWLLGSAIYFLNILCQPNRVFFNVQHNKPLAWLLKKTVYRQFCTGENGAEVRQTLKELKSLGFKGSILTYARETVFDHRSGEVHGLGIAAGTGVVDKKCPAIEAWRVGVLESADMLGDTDQLAVKLTGAGPVVTEAFVASETAPPQMMEALHELCRECKRRGMRVLIDAESQHYQSGIDKTSLELMREHNKDGHAVVFNTYQAYLKNTPDTIAQHLSAASRDNFTMGLKVVRGAYLTTEKRTLIHDTKQDTDNAYNAIAQGALKREFGGFGGEGNPPFPSLQLILAGHNLESVTTARLLHQQRIRDGMPTVPVAFAQLHGMADRISFKLLDMRDEHGKQPEVYKCSTWGTLGECIAYLSRRAMENRDAASRTVEEYRALRAEVWRRGKALFSMRAQK